MAMKTQVNAGWQRVACGYLLLLALVAGVQLWLQRAPSPAPATAPATAFSAARALALLSAWDRAPHALGTAAHDQVRDAILAQLAALGLQGEVATGSALLRLRGPYFEAGYVQNITAVLPGTEPGGDSVLLVAHYDSAPRAGGAGDDGAGVAAVLETLRALRASPPTWHNVIALFSDGEEAGLLGAARFAEHNSLAGHVRVVLNFEGRGDRGATRMFETSGENGLLVRKFAAAGTGTTADSLFDAVYEKLPNDTDLSVFKERGYAGLNFAYTGGFAYYHSPLDTVGNLSPAALQSQGQAMLATARHFAQDDLSLLKAPDAVYFNPVGTWTLVYAQRRVREVVVLVWVLFVAVFAAAWWRHVCGGRDFLVGVTAPVAAVMASAVAVNGLWHALLWLRPDWEFMPQGQPYRPDALVGLMLSATLLIVALLYAWLGRRFAGAGLGLGALLWWLMLADTVAALMPGAAHALQIPLLFLLAAWLGALLWPTPPERRIRRRLPLLFCGAVPMALLTLPLAVLLTLLLPFAQAGAGAALFALTLTVLAPFLARAGRGVVFAAAVLVVASGALALVQNRTSPTQARPDSVAYVEDIGAHGASAHWESRDPEPDAFTAQLLGDHPVRAGAVLRTPAPALPLAPPLVELAASAPAGGGRTLRLHLSSPRGATTLRVYLGERVVPLAAELDGEPVVLSPPSPRYPPTGRSWGFVYAGLRPQGLDLTVTVPTNQPLELVVSDISFGLPSLPGRDPKPRADDAISAAFYPTDSATVTKRYRF